MAMKVFINGMGVVGRQMLRRISNNPDIFEIRGINDPHISDENLVYLLNHDSIYHDFDDHVTSNGNGITIYGKNIPVFHETDPANLPVSEFHIEAVVECTGDFASKSQLLGFINAGAQRVFAVYSIADVEKSIVYGVNQQDLTVDDVYIGMLPVECQAAAIVLDALNHGEDVNYCYVNAFTSYTNAQNTIDSMISAKSKTAYQQGRAGAWNIVPYGPNDTKRIGKIIAGINGRLQGFNYRAPIIDGGAVDIVADLNVAFDRDTFLGAAKATGLVDADGDPLVSSDMTGRDVCAMPIDYIQDLGKTDGNSFIRFTVLYDNIQFQVAQAMRILEYYYNKYIIN